MGLDAIVYCDCFERGLLRTPPRPEWRVSVDDNGSRCPTAADRQQSKGFYAWNESACEHPDGILLHHRIGPFALVGILHRLLSQHAQKFPVILSKIIYNGVHCGDFLTLEDLKALIPELASLQDVHAESAEDEELLRGFEEKLKELTNAALSHGKPIAF